MTLKLEVNNLRKDLQDNATQQISKVPDMGKGML